MDFCIYPFLIIYGRRVIGQIRTNFYCKLLWEHILLRAISRESRLTGKANGIVQYKYLHKCLTKSFINRSNFLHIFHLLL